MQELLAVLPHVATALVTLVTSGALVWRTRVVANASLQRAMIARLTRYEEDAGFKDTEIAALKAEVRQLRHSLEALATELDELRSSISSGHSPVRKDPSSRFVIAKEMPSEK